MISYEQALQIARMENLSFDFCTEYDTAYVFKDSKEEQTNGSSSPPIVVMKEDGRTESHQLFLERQTTKAIHSFLVEQTPHTSSDKPGKWKKEEYVIFCGGIKPDFLLNDHLEEQHGRK